MNRTPGSDGPADEPWRSRLRAGDPLGGEEASAEETAALARLALRVRALEATPPSRPLFALAAPYAAALAALVAVAWIGTHVAERAVPGALSARRARPPAAAPEPAARQLQFETPGGTRIIWVLDPRFTF